MQAVVHDNPVVTKAFLQAIAPLSLQKLLQGVQSGHNNTCFDLTADVDNTTTCLKIQCLGVDDVARLYNISSTAELDSADLPILAPAVVYTLTQPDSCISHQNLSDAASSRPSTAAVWGFSFLFVTLINLCSLTGIVVLPCIKMNMYKVILMFMVSLAVGTLAGSSILVLIPEALDLMHKSEAISRSYVWKMTTVMGGIYLFFVLERFMRMINMWREDTKEKKRKDEMATLGTLTSSFTRHQSPGTTLKLKDPSSLSVNSNVACSCTWEEEEENDPENPAKISILNGKPEAEDVEPHTLDCKDKKHTNGHHASHHHHHQHGDIAPVAYMVIFGDGVHNFIDGLSIGAAFTESTLAGISISVAVMCEELPHELGDFAILLNAGMRLRKALMYNFLSACMCYFGVIVGVALGQHTTAHTWIFGLAGGMFLYISLVDMVSLVDDL
ncbi:hypothetical protein C0Q70_05270 [Pomacea canaliculata]|uniref:Zinc transporter ZIP14 n=1 Tax=Pomacea canaliculata TaxID=400727 RepID=A0A2T7PKR9_POMCA|nr:hypothetical protein C0Q70_05270 [Pomacea canaliculata]